MASYRQADCLIGNIKSPTREDAGWVKSGNAESVVRSDNIPDKSFLIMILKNRTTTSISQLKKTNI